MNLDNQSRIIEKAFSHVSQGKKIMKKLNHPVPEIDKRIKEAAQRYNLQDKVLRRIIYVNNGR